MSLAKKLEQNLPFLALQQVQKNWIDDIDNSNIFAVKETWHKGELPKHDEVICVKTVKAFEAQVQAPTTKMIYLANDVQITLELVKRILKRNPLEKTIFWEV